MDPYTNFAITRVEPFSSSDVIIEVPTGAKDLFPDPSVDGAFDVTVWNATDYELAAEDPHKEIIRITGNESTTEYNITRAQQSTTTRNHNISDKIYKIARTVNAKDFDDIDPDSFEPAITYPTTSPETKFYRGDKTWHQVIIGSGGFSANLYPTNTADAAIAGYKQLSYTPDSSEVEKSGTVNNSTALVETYLFPDELGTSSIPAGQWRSTAYAKTSSEAATSSIVLQYFVRETDDSETNLFTMESEDINSTTYTRVVVESGQNEFSVNSTDRLGVRVSVKTTRTTSTTINYIIGSPRALYSNTTLPTRHSQLRDLNGDSDYLHVTSTEKSDWDDKLDSSSYTPEADIYDTNSITSSATPAPTGDSKRNEYYITALEEAATFAAPSGTPANGNMLFIRIKDDGTARGLSWNAIYEGISDTLPSTTTISKTMFLLFAYNSASSKWQLISLLEEE